MFKLTVEPRLRESFSNFLHLRVVCSWILSSFSLLWVFVPEETGCNLHFQSDRGLLEKFATDLNMHETY